MESPRRNLRWTPPRSDSCMAGLYDNGSPVGAAGSDGVGRRVGADLMRILSHGVDRLPNIVVLTDDDVEPPVSELPSLGPRSVVRCQRRSRRGLGIGLAIAGLGLLVASPSAASAAEARPRPTEPPGALDAALDCSGDLPASAHPPVLLVPGTLTSADEAWGWGYRKVLAERGHAVCTVSMPDHAFGDAQRNVEYVQAAIREVARRGGRPLAMIGHSQGAFQALLALRVWPELAAHVDDVVGLAGAYDHGSDFHRAQLEPGTRTPESRPFCSERCVPWFHQLASGSRLLRELGKRDLPSGPSYTAVGTLHDEMHTPQPKANELPSADSRRSVQIQEICPGRRQPAQNHGSLLLDAVAFALAIDALEHSGPADPTRVPPAVCGQAGYEGLDYAGFVRAAAGFGPRFAQQQREVRSEPPLRCALDPDCEDETSWAVPLLERIHLLGPVIRATARCPRGCRTPRTASLRVRGRGDGWIRLRLERGGRTAVVTDRIRIGSGERWLGLNSRGCGHRQGWVCRRLAPGAYRVRVETMPFAGGYWTRERTLPLRVVRR